MKQLPIGIQTFEHLITGDFLYVDKTRHIYELIKPASARYFLSRPRRFGKSLLVTTLKAIFEGKRGLFDGLAIADMPYDWEVYPIIHLDLSGKKVDTADDLTTYLCNQINLIAAQYDIQLEWESYEERFAELIRKLATINRVAVLIDEYDKPILDNIGRTEQVREIKETLSAFYGIIKASDAHLRFVLLTGVSKFSKVSIFSKLNNLEDLTMDANYADMLGYTQTELKDYFQEYLKVVCRQFGLTMPALLEKIEHWYNGYRFSTRDTKVYNPISTMLMLKKLEFKSYWFETGTPTFLIDLIKSSRYHLSELEHLYTEEEAFSTFEVEHLEIEPLLVQTGYLTIKDYSPEDRIYTLSYPNYEVKSVFNRRLLSAYAEISDAVTSGSLFKLTRALKSGDPDEFFQVLRIFFANIPYDIQLKHEKYYQSIFYLIFSLIGLRIEAEVRTSSGRADAVVQTDSAIFIFEFKLFDTRESALAQIKEKQYYLKYKGTGKPICLIGVEFNKDERNIGGWTMESLSGFRDQGSGVREGYAC